LAKFKHIQENGHSKIQYNLFYSKEYNQIILGTIKEFSNDLIKLIHYQITSDDSEGYIKIKKCKGCNLNERSNYRSVNCWVSTFKYNTFRIDIVGLLMLF
jgi:hypothetical protein